MTANRLHGRPRSVGIRWDSRDYSAAARADNDEWDLLLKEWGALNRLKVSRAAFGPRRLSGLKTRPLFGDRLYDALEDTFGFPACDNSTRFQRNRRPAAIVTEPDGDEIDDLDALRTYAATLGLAVHQPPNPYASFLYPGRTQFAVITKPDFGPVIWLPEQLEFDRRPELPAT